MWKVRSFCFNIFVLKAYVHLYHAHALWSIVLDKIISVIIATKINTSDF